MQDISQLTAPECRDRIMAIRRLRDAMENPDLTAEANRQIAALQVQFVAARATAQHLEEALIWNAAFDYFKGMQ